MTQELTNDTINLTLIGEVNEEMTQYVMDELYHNDISHLKVLNIHISSQGGMLHDCFAIIDYIEYIQRKTNCIINTYGLGVIASAGFFLFLLGNNRMLYPRCRVFVHTHISNSEPIPYNKQLISMNEDKCLNKLYVDYVKTRLTLSVSKANKLLALDTWLSDAMIDTYNIITAQIYNE